MNTPEPIPLIKIRFTPAISPNLVQNKVRKPRPVSYCGVVCVADTVAEGKERIRAVLKEYVRADVEFGIYRGVTYLIEPIIGDGRVWWAYSYDMSYDHDGPIHYRTMSFEDKPAARAAFMKHLDSLLNDRQQP